MAYHSFAQEQLVNAKKVQWEQFKEQEGNNWEVRWNQETGVPNVISNGLSKPYSGTPESIARQFLTEHRALFSMKSTLNDLRHSETQTNRGVHHVTFDQYYKGVRVEDAEYLVHIRENGQVDMANGNYHPNINIPITAPTTGNNAVLYAKANLGATVAEKDNSTSELVIVPIDDTYKLAYKVHVLTENPYYDWDYIIDANEGSILKKYNRVKGFHNDEALITTGTGKVYPKHPLNSTLTNKSLFGLAGNNKLDGTYVTVLNETGPEASSSTHSFIYSTSSTHFDEVSLYFHVDSYRRNFIESLDADDNLFDHLEATAHTGNTWCSGNACFQPTPFALFFSDTYGYAREDKVVYHEYTHAVIYDIEDGIASFATEEGAISEGTPDYFAGAATGRAKIGESLGPVNKIRDMSSPFYSNYSAYQLDNNDGTPVSPQAGGEFFSSILWDIRNNSTITDGEADFLVFDALFRVSGTPDFLDFRDAMKAADVAAYSGTHRYMIHDMFADKGVGVHSPLFVNVSGPITMDEGTSETWTSSLASHTYSTAPYTYEWTRDIPGQSSGVVGTGSSYSGTQYDDFSLDVLVTDANGKTGIGEISVLVDDGGGCIFCKQVVLPTAFTLSNNYPNPFNPSTQIKFELPETAEVSIKVYNIVGQQVATLVNDQMQAGFHNATFEADNLASGVYIARLTATGSSGEQFVSEIKMQLIK